MLQAIRSPLVAVKQESQQQHNVVDLPYHTIDSRLGGLRGQGVLCHQWQDRIFCCIGVVTTKLHVGARILK